MGVMTVPARRDDLLPQTLESLRQAGFSSPRLFVDGAMNREAPWWEEKFGLPVTARYPHVKVAGNWLLSLQELYLRDPRSKWYAIFQDDVVFVRNLKEYLERCPHPEKGYLNLYTYPNYQKLFPQAGLSGRQEFGWIRTTQEGLGALGLAFPNEGARLLLSSSHMVNRPWDSADRGWRYVDGGIVDSMRKAGWAEYCHNPSLCQHVGVVSAMDKRLDSNGTDPDFPRTKYREDSRSKRFPEGFFAKSFPGETFDALSLLPDVSVMQR